MILYLSTSLVLIGLAIHLATLAPLRRLIALVPAGTLRNKWIVITGLVLLFIAGYIGYVWVLWGPHIEWIELSIPVIFLFGAVFVWLTIALSLQTTVDLRRMDQLETENITDQLTQVYNRRYLDRRLDAEVARSRRYSLPLSILLLDIDHFKRVNDTYGHQTGDLVLSALGSLIKTALRDLDVVARYGGEEFLLICVNTDIDGAAMVAERLRQTVESNQVEITDGSGERQNIRTTISIGAARMGGGIDSKERLVQAADRALYRAKEEGRNRVVIAPTGSGVSAIPIQGVAGSVSNGG